MKVLVTGIAGFIGFHIAKKLLETGHEVVGIDNLNDYYNVQLKIDRLKELDIVIENRSGDNKVLSGNQYQDKLSFSKMDLTDKASLENLFKSHSFDVVCHLAAQAGVRYSLENPHSYIDSNIVGFMNILENCRKMQIPHLVYASSSSVYGLNDKIPFSAEHTTEEPISIYAATKKSNELMAYTYSHLFGLFTTGLRFFTVYGPWGRPDMAIYKFTEAISKERPIQVYNYGEAERDFTYIDDIVVGLYKVITETNRKTPYKIYNIGYNKPEKLSDFIAEIEKNLGKKAIKEMLPMQPGDVLRTWANVEPLVNDYGYRPKTDIQIGISKFVGWYKTYHNI
ncbi:MAG: NAD-dependent epimerase [Muricauda sp.]|nr:NAD-dependent epimerase/dehydratase family protein [Allomuricauda sp.]MBC30833.1 NAD-dependent epimerase [Allomuricauda sp.]|tara:strand:+ start:1013 stop:2026 length:1014 start_codon:yes stop_codon:yes gene_type:complete